MHFDKIVPLIIAVVLIYLNTRKKSKKQSTAAKPQATDSQNQKSSSDQGFFNPLFKGIDDILNVNQPVIQPVSKAEPEAKKPVPKKEPSIPEPVITTSTKSNIAFQEPFVESEYIDFDAKRAFIYSEIFNRKYFTI